MRVVSAANGRTFARAYTPQETVQYENLVRLMASQAMGMHAPLDGPVAISLRVTVPVPQSWSGRKQSRAVAGVIMPTGKPDLDNVAKALFDGMNGIVFRDDAQICDARKSKRYGFAPGVEVRVWPLLDSAGNAFPDGHGP